MNKLLKATCLVIGAVGMLQAEPPVARGISFFSDRPHYTQPIRYSFFRNDLITDCDADRSTAFEIVPFGGKSTNSRELARYFLPATCSGDCCLTFREINSQNPASDNFDARDIDASNFNIATNNGTFRSTVCLNPQQKFFGVGLTLKQRLGCCDDSDCIGWWLEVSTAVEKVTNRMHLTETILDNGGGADGSLGLDNAPHVGSVSAAFRQSNWNFGRIDDCFCESKVGLADVDIKVGWNSVNTEDCYLSSYLGVVIPTGNRVTGVKLWQPIVGNNHHFGIIFGSFIGFDLCQFACGPNLEWKLDLESRYLLPNHQVRSLDPIGKPWGRYLATYRDTIEAAAANNPTSATRVTSGTSGINAFTRCVRVKPNTSYSATSAFILSQDCGCGTWMLEGGLNFFARDEEEIEFDRCDDFRAAVKSPRGFGDTSFARTIKNAFVSSSVEFPSYAQLRVCDLDPRSAAHPGLVGYIFYGTLGYKWSEECPGLVAVGGSYEAGSVNTVMRRWTLWGKAEVAF